jgi:hypothetical protein
MDQFSFHGPFAYRWINDVPVERIDLRSGERRPIEVGDGGLGPAPLGDEPEDDLAPPGNDLTPPGNDLTPPGHAAGEASVNETIVRAAMAAWN